MHIYVPSETFPSGADNVEAGTIFSPAFSITYPKKCLISPLNPVFLPFIAFFVPKCHRFNSINLTNSTRRNLQVSPWTVSWHGFPFAGNVETVLVEFRTEFRTMKARAECTSRLNM